MGIYLQSFAKRGWLPSSNMPVKLVDAAREWAQAARLGDLFFGQADADASLARISIYPFADDVVFRVDRDRVSFGVKTSMAGPGYHAALVDLCDWLQRKLDLKWRWDANGDSSDYARTRDKAELEDVFVGQLRANLEHLAKITELGAAAAMNLQAGLGHLGEDKVATPMGWMDFDTVAHLTVSGDDEFYAFAAAFYPWWRENDGPLFWANTLRSLLWAEAEWRQPASEREQHVHKAIFAASERLRQKNNLPPELGQAIEELRQSQQTDGPVDSVIGYRRMLRHFDLTGPWSIKAPGYYREQIENDGNCICIWTPGEEIRGTSFLLKPNASAEPAWPGNLKDRPEQDAPTFAFRVAAVAEPIQEPGYRTAWSECVGRGVDGDVHVLLLSVTGKADETILLERLAAHTRNVVFQLPSPPNERLDA